MPFFRNPFQGNIDQPPIQKPGSPSTEVGETMAYLMSIVSELDENIPREDIDGIFNKLRPILEEPGHAPYSQIISRASHPCVAEYLPEALRTLRTQQANAVAAAQGLRSPDRENFLEEAKMQKEVYYTSIAELLGRGFTVALKPNLEFDENNNPKGVRKTDQTRFPKCHAALSGAGRKKTIKKKNQKKRVTLRRRKMRRNVH